MSFKKMNQGLWTSIIASVLVATLAGCDKSGNSDSKDKGNKTDAETGGEVGGSTVAADGPADSTGVMAVVKLGFGTLAPASGLALQGGSTLDVGGGVMLSDARISVGSIKVKANKEMDDAEKGLKQELENEKKSRESALEADKKALEQEKEALETKYEPQFEAAGESDDDSEKDALKEQMKAEEALIEEKMAALEAKKDGELADLEEQRDGNLKWRGPYVYSLIDNSVSPAIPEVQLVDGSYKRIEFKVKPNRTLDGADPLLNNAIYLAGTATVGGVATPFTASFRVDEEFKLMGAGALKVDPSVSNALTIAFNPTAWFSGVDFSTATLDATGAVVVSADSNPNIYKAIRENVKRSTKFGEDEDGDGKLKDEESEGDGDEGQDAEEAEGDENEDEGDKVDGDDAKEEETETEDAE